MRAQSVTTMVINLSRSTVNRMIEDGIIQLLHAETGIYNSYYRNCSTVTLQRAENELVVLANEVLLMCDGKEVGHLSDLFN